jgi:hypothetical protein
MRDLIGAQIPAGRCSGKAVTLKETCMFALGIVGYTVDRRLLGTLLYWVEREKRYGHDPTILQVYIPVGDTRFFLVYDGELLSIGCYNFSKKSTRDIVRWSQEAI